MFGEKAPVKLCQCAGAFSPTSSVLGKARILYPNVAKVEDAADSRRQR